MRIWLLVVLVGCGSVKGDEIDAPTAIDAAIDSPVQTCTDMSSINSCGPACAVCSSTGDREMPTCNGNTCGITCRAGAPRCSDNSCSKTVFDFTSQTVDGITPRAPNGLVLAVRTFQGSPALAVDITNLSEISFRIPVCLSGNGPFSTRTLTAKVFYSGIPATTTGGQFYVQASVPQPQTGAFLAMRSLDAGMVVNYTSPLSMSNQSAMTTDIVFQTGTYGQPFSGTIWFDDIKIE